MIHVLFSQQTGTTWENDGLIMLQIFLDYCLLTSLFHTKTGMTFKSLKKNVFL